jgi:predicted nuclease of predicted toxin-antitoxin system
MKLLYDNNLSHKLVARLNDIFPDSTHVMMENLDESEDQIIWLFAKKEGYTIVTKDVDYNEISVIKGFPPKIIWLKIGNCKIQDVERIIRNKTIVINDFYQNKNTGIIEIN